MQPRLTRIPSLPPLFAALCAFPLWAGDAHRFYEDALERYRKGELQETVIQLKNALQQDGSHLPSRLLLGRALLAAGQPAQAEQELLTARGLQADPALVDPLLARAQLLQGKLEQLVEGIDPTRHNPQAALELFLLRADALFLLERDEPASQDYRDALQLAPDDPRARQGLAYLQLRQGEPDQALKLAEALTRSHPEFASGWLLTGRVWLRLGEPHKALAALGRSLELDPSLAAARLQRAALWLDLGQAGQAESDLEILQRELPYEPMVSYLQALTHQRAGRSEPAQRAIQRANDLLHSVDDDSLIRHGPSLLLAGELALRMDRPDAARMYFSTYLDSHPGDVTALKRLAGIMLSRREPQAALELLRPALEAAPRDPQVPTLMGYANLDLLDFDEAGAWFRQAGVLAPEDTRLPLLLARSELLASNPQEAIEALEATAAGGSGDLEGALLLAELQLETGELQAARSLLSELLAHRPDNAALNLLGITYMADRQADIARTSFEQVLESEPDNLSALLNLVRLDLEQGAADQAAARLDALPEPIRHTPAVLTHRALLEENRGRPEDALALYRQAWEQDSRSRESGLRLVAALLRAGRQQQALQVAESLQTAFPQDIGVLEAVGLSELATGQHDLAQLSFRHMATLASYNSRRLLQIARLQLRAGDPRSAYWSLYKAAEADPADPAGQLLLGTMELQLGKTQEAGERADALQNAHPQRYEAQVLSGELALHEGRFEAALQAFEAAHRLNPSTLTLNGLYRALQRSGNPGKALDLLEDWVRKQPGDRASRHKLASALARARRHREAMEHYQLLLRDKPEDPFLLNDLALLRQATGTTGALEAAQLAYRLAPQEPRLADTLGWILVASGDPQQGLRYLREAVSRLADDPEIRYHIAAALQALGKVQDAQRELALALDGGRDFTGRADAESLLTQLRRAP